MTTEWGFTQVYYNKINSKEYPIDVIVYYDPRYWAHYIRATTTHQRLGTTPGLHRGEIETKQPITNDSTPDDMVDKLYYSLMDFHMEAVWSDTLEDT